MEEKRIPEQPRPNTMEIYRKDSRSKEWMWWFLAVGSVFLVGFMWWMVFRWATGVIAAGC